MIYDENFLLQLQKYPHRVIYGKIIALSKEERELESIEGRITNGSISGDGKSALRRTCSLSLVSKKTDICNYYWSFSNKFKLEIGLQNNINNYYPDIIWFPQGTYIITSFSNALSINSNQINISGKDKMCLLNGEVGGTFNSQIDFGQLEQADGQGNILIKKIPIKQIIREMVHQYAGEPFYNIIINDLDDTALESEEYRLENPLYIWKAIGENTFENGTLDSNIKVGYEENGIEKIINLKEIPQYEPLIELHDLSVTPTEIYFLEDKTKKYTVAKIEFGDVAGYKETDLVYDGDLIAAPGETITSILDKIKNMLSFYEYYYNLEGQFIFEKKKEYKREAKIFEGNSLLTAFNNTPNLREVRNDFTVWGKRKSISGAEIPIHIRYGIQSRPTEYTTIQVSQDEVDLYNKAYGLNVKPQNSKTYSTKDYDWRELIYQMSLDYHAYNHLDNFELKIIQANKNNFVSGLTGYEPYYIDMEGFWRQLYNPNVENELSSARITLEQLKMQLTILENENPQNIPKITDTKIKINSVESEIAILSNFFTEGTLKYWNKDIVNAPEQLNFYFDLIDTEGTASQFSNEAIGNRPKVNNNDKIKAISYREIPMIIFGPVPSNPKTGYRYFNLKGFENAFQISTQGKSGRDEIKQLLANYSDCIENISLTTIPVYDVEPGSLIKINNFESGINGDYIITKFTLPLTHNGTMNIIAQKNIQLLY